MNAKGWLISIVLSFAPGAGGGYVVNELHGVRTLTSQQVTDHLKDTDTRVPRAMVEIIADQIATANSSCPEEDLLTYETCILFQGALGTWQRLGLPDSCPSIINTLSLPKRDETIKITREDVRRAIETPCFGHLYAINVANTTPILVSTANRSFQMAAVPNFSEPGSDPGLCLAARYGICGNHAAVAIGFFEKAGFKARPVEFYYDHDGNRFSHIIVEAWIDNHWRLIDSTYGAYWTVQKSSSSFELMSTDGILTGKERKIFFNDALMTFYFFITGRGDLFSYLTVRADIIRGGSGEITVTLKEQEGRENFLHRPNFVGDNISDRQSGGIQFRLVSSDATYRLIVNVSSAAISNGANAFICIDESCEKYSDDKREYSFVVKGPSRLYLKTDTDVAYAVLKSIDWKVVSN
jgi:hypothetical protein